MIDAKGHYEELLSKPFGQRLLATEWIKQAGNQIAAAQAAGNRQVEWWFYEQSSANFAEKVFDRDGIGDQIIIRQQDYPGDAKWPYPASAPWAKGRQKR